MAEVLLFNKPYGVLSQFTDAGGRATLADFLPAGGVYPAGRLDRDSEGLLLLTDDGRLQHRLSDPRYKQPKTYWVQLEGEVDETALQSLEAGVNLKEGPTRPARAAPMSRPPSLWARTPPIRVRRRIPTSWISLTITEGRNRQVRRMTAAVGFPTLRLIRVRVGHYQLDDLGPGEYRRATPVDSADQGLGKRPREARNPR